MNTAKPDMTDADREAHIQECGRLMQQKMEAGNREAAMNWMQAMHEAIRLRSAAQVAAMEQERGLAPCFFTEQGAKDRIWLLERQAA